MFDMLTPGAAKHTLAALTDFADGKLGTHGEVYLQAFCVLRLE